MNSKKHFKSFVDKVHERLNEEKYLLLASSDEEDEKGRRTPILLETFGNDDVVIWIELFAKYPSIQNVSGMRIQLERATEEWMERFLSHDGLECLLEALEILSNAKKHINGTGRSWYEFIGKCGYVSRMYWMYKSCNEVKSWLGIFHFKC